MVPRETLFRPISSFVIAVFDLLNAMNQKPGVFQRIGHDYRIDLRGSLQKAFGLTASETQAVAIEAALRSGNRCGPRRGWWPRPPCARWPVSIRRSTSGVARRCPWISWSRRTCNSRRHANS